MLVRLGLALMWLLHFLPLAALATIGRGIGFLFYILGHERRKVALTNLALCFPHWGPAEQRRVARAHFRSVGRAALEHGILWWSSKERIQGLVRIEGLEHWRAVAHRPVIWLAPHFVGLDMGGARIITEWRGCSVYSHQKNPVFDRVLLRGRTRFVEPVLFSRQDGVRRVVRTIREGLPFYYLPDMDFGSRDSIFVPFFGVSTATITGLSRLARLAKAVVVPAVTRQLPGEEGYVLTFYPAWTDFPGPSMEEDTRRMNAFIEERVVEMPEQYFWLHKRFKTRPPGEARFY
jgi:Kdo2-lipid IVA lauroyltransferase/acyltransferase